MHKDDKIKLIETYVVGAVVQWAVRHGQHKVVNLDDTLDAEAVMNHAHGLMPGVIRAVVQGKTTYGSVGDLQLQIESDLKKMIESEPVTEMDVSICHLDWSERYAMQALAGSDKSRVPLEVWYEGVGDSDTPVIRVPEAVSGVADTLEHCGFRTLSRVIRWVQENRGDIKVIRFTDGEFNRLPGVSLES